MNKMKNLKTITKSLSQNQKLRVKSSRQQKKIRMTIKVFMIK